MTIGQLRGTAMTFAGLFGAAGVAMAAVAAHLGPRLLSPQAQAILRQGVEIQMWHALALLAAAAALRRADLVSVLAVSGLITGTVLFCAGVYALSLGGVRLGPAAPIGGSVLIASWILLGIAGWRPRRRRPAITARAARADVRR